MLQNRPSSTGRQRSNSTGRSNRPVDQSVDRLRPQLTRRPPVDTSFDRRCRIFSAGLRLPPKRSLPSSQRECISPRIIVATSIGIIATTISLQNSMRVFYATIAAGGKDGGFADRHVLLTLSKGGRRSGRGQQIAPSSAFDVHTSHAHHIMMYMQREK